MSTIDALVRSGDLVTYELPDWERRSPVRRFVYAPEIEDWFDGEPRAYDGSIKYGGRTPDEHFQQFFADFCCAIRPCVADLKRLEPTSNGIWKAHPQGLRVFGWFFTPDNFVAITAALEADLKPKHKHHLPAKATSYAAQNTLVRNFIKKHDLGKTILPGDAIKIFPPKA